MTDQWFPYQLDPKFKAIWWPLGVGEDDGVTLTDDGDFVATFGRLRLETALENITGAHITRDYRWWTAIGPRLSFVDDGLTFGTSTSQGVCVHFDERVHRVIGFKDHSAITVTVADAEGLVTALGFDPDGSDKDESGDG